MRWMLSAALLLSAPGVGQAADPPKRPNIVFILTDDQGYGDLSAHGNPILKTPNLDHLHAEGVRFTDFHVSPTCSPTRSALLTGRHEFKNGVTHTSLERERLTPKATTLAEVLGSAGYATDIFGKWHLGTRPAFFPTRNGFDEWAGLPYSNDNGPLHPTVRSIPPLPLYEDDTVVERDPDQSQLTRRFTEKAVGFIRANRARPGGRRSPTTPSRASRMTSPARTRTWWSGSPRWPTRSAATSATRWRARRAAGSAPPAATTLRRRRTRHRSPTTPGDAMNRCPLALLVGLALSATAPAAEPRPNVVVFLADDLGYGDLGCYGHPRIRTPNLDAFAAQGVRLTQCYAASAVCSPSRSALLTGRTPHRNGVYTWIAEGSEVHLPASEITLPRLLKGAGYATCHVGKWHLNGRFNDPAQPQPGDHGYGHWMATQNNAAPSHKDPANFVRNGEPVGRLDGFSAPLVVDEAIDWLATKRDKARPFFLAVWTHEPHLPIETDPRFQEPYGDLVEDFRQHHGNVTQLDHAFGKLMKALDEQGLADATFVAFTADNGPEGDGTKGRTRGRTGGLRGRKRSMYEGGIRVPGIVRWPGHIEPGTTVDVPVIGSDLFPTILGLCGVEPPGDRVIDGADVRPVLTGKLAAVERKVPLYWRLDMAPPKEDLHMAFRDGGWKLLASQDFSHFELYNLEADPRETTDLKAEEAERFGAMRKALERLNAEIEREGPDWWKRLSPNGGGPVKKDSPPGARRRT